MRKLKTIILSSRVIIGVRSTADKYDDFIYDNLIFYNIYKLSN